MGVWGYKPLESDCGLDIRGEVIFDRAAELEHQLRDVRRDQDLQELHIALANALLLYAITRHCGNGTYNSWDVERWRANSFALLDRLLESGEEDIESLNECKRSLSDLFRKLARYVEENDMNFLSRYSSWRVETFGDRERLAEPESIR